MPSYFRSNIQSMSGYVPGEQPQGDGFIKLNTNENPYPPSPAVAVAVNEALTRAAEISRPDSGELSPLCEPITGRAAAVDPGGQRQRRHPHDRDPRPGGRRATAAVAVSQLYPLPYAGRVASARSEEIHFQPDWTLPPAFAQGGDNLRLVFLANPNSPSGTVVPPEAVLELARRLPCPLLVDEAYADFAQTNCMELVTKNEKIMVSRTLSKSYALAGLRFGYLVAQPHLIEQFVKVKDSYNCDALSIAAATAAIGDQGWLARTREKILGSRGRLATAMRDLGFIVPDSQANFVWAAHGGRSIRPLYEELKRRRILVRYMEYRGWGDGLRITVGTDAEIDACVEGWATCCSGRRDRFPAVWVIPFFDFVSGRPLAGRVYFDIPISSFHFFMSPRLPSSVKRRRPRSVWKSISTASAVAASPRASAFSTTCSRSWPSMRPSIWRSRPAATCTSISIIRSRTWASVWGRPCARPWVIAPASAATGTLPCPWTRRWPAAWSIWAGDLFWSSKPSSPRPRSATSTANWWATSGRPSP